MNGILVCVCPQGCAVHHLAFSVHPRRYTGMGQVFTFAQVGLVEYCASQNATPELLIRMKIPAYALFFCY